MLKMKYDENKDLEFENLLKSKMEEMASSVDCFDKISRRAFPEINSEQSDHEVIVSDLENVTGKKRRFRFAPAIAVAAAAAICVFVFPKTGGFKEFFSNNIASSDKDIFRDLICEIKKETSKNSYEYYDFTLEEYVKYGRLISPLYRCPFEAKDKDNINVRLYVRMHDDLPTNQVYAVEYEGNYSNENFIAAADSVSKFTDSELNNFEYEFNANENIYAESPSYSAFGKEAPYITDMNGEPASVAQFNYPFIGKSEEGINVFVADFMYCHPVSDTENQHYMYDCNIFKLNGYEAATFTAQAKFFTNSVNTDEYTKLFNDNWNNSVYYSGDPAMDANDTSVFTPYDLIMDSVKSNSTSYSFIAMQTDISGLDPSSLNNLLVWDENNENIGSILAPLNSSYFNIFIPTTNKPITVTDEKREVYAEFICNNYSSGKYIYTINTGGRKYDAVAIEGQPGNIDFEAGQVLEQEQDKVIKDSISSLNASRLSLQYKLNINKNIENVTALKEIINSMISCYEQLNSQNDDLEELTELYEQLNEMNTLEEELREAELKEQTENENAYISTEENKEIEK